MSSIKLPGNIKDAVIKINDKQLKLSKLIGEGAFSYVYYSYDIVDKTEYAIKQVRTYADSKFTKVLKNELQALEKLSNCKYIIKFYGHIKHISGSDLMILEYCPNSLFSYLQKRMDTPLEDNQILKIFGQVTTAIEYMHSLNPPLINFDLKIDNILLNKTNTVCLCDFGSVTTEITKPNADWTHNQRCLLEASLLEITSPQYRAPEILDLYLNYEIGTKVDIWALGCIAYFLCYFTYPFEDGAKLAILNIHYKFYKTSPFITQNINPIIDSIFVLNPSERPTATNLIERIVKLAGKLNISINDTIFPIKSTSMEQILKQNTQAAIENVVSKATNIFGSIKEASQKIKTQINQKPKQIKPLKLLKFFTSRVAIIPCPNLPITITEEDTLESLTTSLPAEKLAEYLDHNFPSSYHIINLINSALYPVDIFCNNVSTYNMNIQEIPDLFKTINLLKTCLRFLSKDHAHYLLLIHCTDGGYLSHYFASLLLIFSRALSNFKYFFNKIISHLDKIAISSRHYSFIRLAGYIELLSNNPGYIIKQDPIYLEEIIITPVFLCNKNKTCCRPFITISIDGKLVYSSVKNPATIKQFNISDTKIVIPVQVSLLGNINIFVYHVSRLKSQLVQKKIFSLYFHTGFTSSSNVLTFYGKDLDISSPSLFDMLKNTTMTLNLSTNIDSFISLNIYPFNTSIPSINQNICFEYSHECEKFKHLFNASGDLKASDLKKIRVKSMSNILDFAKESVTLPSLLDNVDGIFSQPQLSTNNLSDSSDISPDKKFLSIDHNSKFYVQEDLIDLTPKTDNLLDIFTQTESKPINQPVPVPVQNPFDPFTDSFTSSVSQSSSIQSIKSTKPEIYSLNEDLITMTTQFESLSSKGIKSDNLKSDISSSINMTDSDNLLFFSQPSPQPTIIKTETQASLNLNQLIGSSQSNSKTITSPNVFPWSKPGKSYQHQLSTATGSNTTSNITRNNFMSDTTPLTTNVKPSNPFGDPFGDLLCQSGFDSCYNSNSNTVGNKPTLNDVRKRQDDILVQDPVKKAVKEWSEGKQKNIRALLSTLHLILWKTDKWVPIGMHEMTNAELIKKMYRKACLCVHPDKHVGTDHEELAKCIFILLNESWNAFESTGCRVYN